MTLENEAVNEILVQFSFCKNRSRLSKMGTTFETKNKKYFYDSGTGKVLECSDLEYKVLSYLTGNLEEGFAWEDSEEALRETLNNLQQCCTEQHLFQRPEYTGFAFGEDEYIIPKVNEQITQIILELTQQCNLRCRYCIYNEHNTMFRNFEPKHMSWDTAKKAIDYAFEHSGDKVYVTFYGGEPMVKYDLLKQCIDYSCEKRDEMKKTVYFNFTTNLTLITEESAKYFASIDKLSIMGSLDGPKEIHDQYRKTVNGLGSFDQAIRGLRYLVEAYGDRAKSLLSVNGVLTPPYTEEKFNRIKEFYKNSEWIPKDFKVRSEYVDWGDLDTTDIDFEESTIENILDPLKHWCIENICQNNDSHYEFEMQKQALVILRNRYIGDEPAPVIKRNGCCIPGNRRLYVTVDGNFQTCERVGDTPNIGSVRTGIDHQSIKKYYIQEYEKSSIRRCNSCWASHLCGVCYVGCFCKDGIDIKKKDITCISERLSIKNNLSAYYQINEEKPELLMELDKIKLI